MSLDADSIVDRRRMRRLLAGWRIVAILALAILVVGLVALYGGFGALDRRSPQIARLTIGGIITDDRDQLKLIERIGNSPAVEAVIVSISSPGGTTAGGEGLYAALRGLAAKKPTVAYIGSLGASAGYIAALAADHIVARRNAITGSIGVLFQYGDASRLLDTLGVTITAERSGPLKAEPDPFAPASPAAKAMLAGVVADSYDWFLGLVVERRKMAEDVARGLADGRIFTGHQAEAAGLIDATGEEAVAVSWLVSEKGIAKGLPIRDWKIDDDRVFSLPGALGAAFGRGAVDAVFGAIGAIGTSGEARLDGLVSLWQAAGPERDGRSPGATR